MTSQPAARPKVKPRVLLGAFAKKGARAPLPRLPRLEHSQTWSAYANALSETQYLSGLSETVQQLEAWGKWTVERQQKGRCGSLEKYYNFDKDVDLTLKQTTSASLPPVEALRCERAWVKLPQPFKTVIHRRYVAGLPAGHVARICRLKTDTFAHTHRQAVLMMRNLMKAINQ